MEFHIADSVIRGKVDRVDVHKRKVAVIDYKIGRVKDRKYFDFENLQLPLYLRALCEEGFVPSWGRYLSISRPADNSSLPKDSSFDEAVLLSHYYKKGIKNGFFPPYVGKKELDQEEHALYMSKNRPCSYCDYRDLCRVKDGVTRKTGRL